MSDTDALSDQQILALTLLGESESKGECGMQGTALTILNRAVVNAHWMGGSSVRNICLCPKQYQCWDPGPDRDRIIAIAEQNPTYEPYVTAMQIAADALAGRIGDFTDGAVSYFDPPSKPYWAFHKDGTQKEACFVDGSRMYYDWPAVSTRG